MFTRRSIVSLVFVGLAALALGCSASKSTAGLNAEATSTAVASSFTDSEVWPGSMQAAQALQACKFVDDDCIQAVVQKQGGSDAAYAFYQHNGAFLVGLNGTGKVKVGRTFVPWAINSNYHYVLLGGTPSVVSVSDSIRTLLPKPFDGDATFAAVAAAGKKSDYSLWPGDEIFETQSALPAGGQEFVFQSGLHDQCHACGIGVAARIAIDTGASGVATGAKLLGLCQGALIMQDVLNNGTKTTFHDFAGLSVSLIATEPYLVTLATLQTCPAHEAYK